jgi:hypothetical protein
MLHRVCIPLCYVCTRRKPDSTGMIIAKDYICYGVRKTSTHDSNSVPDGIVSIDTDKVSEPIAEQYVKLCANITRAC